MSPEESRDFVRDGGARGLPVIKVSAGLTFGALAAGLGAGLVVASQPGLGWVVRLAGPVGALWLRGLQMTILPLVVALLVLGIVQAAAAAQAGAMARRAVGWILGTYMVSGAAAMVVMPLWLRLWPIPRAAAGALAGSAPHSAGPVPDLAEFVLSILPTNIMSAAAGGEMLPCVVFFALFAMALARVPVGPRQQLLGVFEALAGAMTVMIGWVLQLAPVGVFALALTLAVKTGTAAVGALAHYVALVAGTGGLVLLAGPVVHAKLAGQPACHVGRMRKAGGAAGQCRV